MAMNAEKLGNMIMQSMDAYRVMALPDADSFEVPTHAQRGLTTTNSVQVSVFFGDVRFNVTITKAR